MLYVKWWTRTARIANARMPSSEGLYFNVVTRRAGARSLNAGHYRFGAQTQSATTRGGRPAAPRRPEPPRNELDTSASDRADLALGRGVARVLASLGSPQKKIC